MKSKIAWMLKNTVVVRPWLTPELQLRLITPECPVWHENAKTLTIEPYWAFYWPGGQALTRFLLDNYDICARKRIFDLGCGCGSGAIAAAISGAKSILANDIDTAALIATRMNAKLNNIDRRQILFDSNNWIEAKTVLRDYDVVLVGDMFYDTAFASTLFLWLQQQLKANGRLKVLLGDPGRHGLSPEYRQHLRALKTYQLPESVIFDNPGITTATVFQIEASKTCEAT